MTDAEPPRPRPSDKDARAARLAEELRANLKRRKQQVRARREGAPVATEPGDSPEPDAADASGQPSV